MEMSPGTRSARRALWILVFIGFAVNYMIRINVNIAIVAMVRQPLRRGGVQSGSSECALRDIHIGDFTSSDAPAAFGNASTDAERALHNRTRDVLSIVQEQAQIFDWDERQQGLVLGAFFWLHWLSQLPGGVLARRYGTKIVFAVSNALPGVIGILIPWASRYDYRGVMAIRFLQGIIAGCCWPSMHYLAGQWIPPDERSNFVTAYLGSSVGAAVTFPLCGVLIAQMGWPAVFYASGAITLVWLTGWWLFVFDSPSQHPRLTPDERRAVEKSLGHDFIRSGESVQTPWRALLSSGPVWVNIIAQWGGVWGLFTLLTQAPTYFNNVHHWDIRMAGLLSGLPHAGRITLAAIVSQVGDYMLREGKLSRTALRKVAAAVCNIGQGVFTLGLAWSGCNAVSAVVCLTLATACSGAVSTGQLASIVDLSPNFASVILGVCAAITVLPGFISPYIVGLLTLGNQSTEQWKKVFVIAGTTAIGTGLIYVTVADSELQSWNTPSDAKGRELQALKPGREPNKEDQPSSKSESKI